jgi:hypothetical protein
MAATKLRMLGGHAGRASMAQATASQGPVTGKPAGGLKPMSTPIDANTRYWRMCLIYLNWQFLQPGGEGCNDTPANFFSGIRHA